MSQRLGVLPVEDLDVLRHPHQEVLHILDPRPLLDDAARLAATYGGGLLIAESLAAALTHGRTFGLGSTATSAASSPTPPPTSASPSASSAAERISVLPHRRDRTTANKEAKRFLATNGAKGIPVCPVGGLLRVPRARLEQLVGGPLRYPSSRRPPPIVCVSSIRDRKRVTTSPRR